MNLVICCRMCKYFHSCINQKEESSGNSIYKYYACTFLIYKNDWSGSDWSAMLSRPVCDVTLPFQRNINNFVILKKKTKLKNHLSWNRYIMIVCIIIRFVVWNFVYVCKIKFSDCSVFIIFLQMRIDWWFILI